ncbi:HlyD family type I secretion periplasmic adaptor subunit [Chromobacterium sp. TRC.1.1.SA]|uniref:Membrane fusion protein (MFP) family protein n=1 Tax=Chromobacterium indicum TaxID=3110228 RepID=A0ABV0CMA0_9NEIS
MQGLISQAMRRVGRFVRLAGAWLRVDLQSIVSALLSCCQRLGGGRLRTAAAAWQRWRAERPQPYQREFLPAALEVLDTPASPAGRAVAGLIVLLFSLALIWSCVGEVDVHAVASGQLVPAGGVKSVQPLEGGIVRQIKVVNGQHVRAGQALVVLDNNEQQADLSQLQRQRQLALLDISRLQAALKGMEQGQTPALSKLTGDRQDLNQQLRLQQQLGAHQARVATLQAQLAESRAVLAASQLEQAKLASRLPLLAEKAEAWKQLSDQKMGARLQWREFDNELHATQQSWQVERQRSAQYQANIARIQAELRQYQAEVRRQTLTELADAEDKAAEAALNILRYSQREQQRVLRAPVSGHVQQLAIHTVGGVVQAAQPLMVIAPDHDTLVVDANVLNQDIGFVRAGQAVTLKVDSYPYSKYGTLSGRVEHLSQDAIPDEKRGPIYAARIRLSAPAVSQTGIELPLQAGMAVTAEIKTDSRRVIDYLLSPIKEVFSEAIKER